MFYNKISKYQKYVTMIASGHNVPEGAVLLRGSKQGALNY